MSTSTKRQTPTKIFSPLQRGDRLRCAYLGPDASAVTLWERQTPLGSQEYAQVCTRLPNVSVCGRGTDRSTALHRIVLHDAGIIAVAMATGRPVRIDAYDENSTEGLRKIGRVLQSLYVDVVGVGHFQVSSVDGLLSGGFTIQCAGCTWGASEPMTAQRLRDTCRHEYGDAKTMRFEDPIAVDASAAA